MGVGLNAGDGGGLGWMKGEEFEIINSSPLLNVELYGTADSRRSHFLSHTRHPYSPTVPQMPFVALVSQFGLTTERGGED